MAELRKDPIIRRWVIVAKERARRPSDFTHAAEERSEAGGFCPFCEGNESKTPPEILAYRAAGTEPNGPGWWVRVIPNKFPALSPDGDLCKRGVGIYDMMSGVGVHEVIVESPEHVRSQTQVPLKQVREVMWAYRDRLLALKKDKRFLYGMIFKNVGKEGGASLYHSHSQLIAVPFVPVRIREEMRGSKEFYDYRGRCVFCDMIGDEKATGERVVEETEEFIAFEPFASRFPFETWILPKRHGSHFEDAGKAQFEDLGFILQRTLFRLEATLPGVSYNYILHTGAFDTEFLEYYHWHIEVIPRLTKVAGFEWGTGVYINPVAPESARGFLMEADMSVLEARVS